MIIVDVLAITSLQRDLPGEVLSRVLGVFDTIVLGGILLASLAAGILLAHAGLDVALIAIGAGFPAIALVGLPALLRADRSSAAQAERLRPRVELLSALDLLAAADRNTLERLAAAATEMTLPAGSTLIREGDAPDALWVLERGELSVTRHGHPAPRTAAGDRAWLCGRAGALARHPSHRDRPRQAGQHPPADQRPGLPVRARGQPSRRLARVGRRDPDGPHPLDLAIGLRPDPGRRHTRRRSAMNPDDRRRDRGVGRMTPSPSAAWLIAMPRLAMLATGIDDAVTTREGTP